MRETLISWSRLRKQLAVVALDVCLAVVATWFALVCGWTRRIGRAVRSG